MSRSVFTLFLLSCLWFVSVGEAAIYEVDIEAKIDRFSLNMFSPPYNEIAYEYGAVGDTVKWKIRYDDSTGNGGNQFSFSVISSPEPLSAGFIRRNIELRDATSSPFSYIVLDSGGNISNIWYYTEKDAIYLLGGYNNYNWVRETGDDSPARHVFFSDTRVTRTMVDPVPVPASIFFLGVGLLGLAGRTRIL